MEKLSLKNTAGNAFLARKLYMLFACLADFLPLRSVRGIELHHTIFGNSARLYLD